MQAWLWALGSAGMLVLYPLSHHPLVRVVDSPWNVEGKVQATLLSLGTAAFLPLTSGETGYTLPSRGGTRWIAAWTLGTLATGVVLGYVLADPADTSRLRRADTYLFQATLPGLDEELFWRGLLPAMLNRIHADTFRVGPVRFTTGDAISTFLYTVGHGVQYANGRWWIRPAPDWIFPGVMAVVLVGLRRHTGSLLPTLTVHNGMTLGLYVGARRALQ